MKMMLMLMALLLVSCAKSTVTIKKKLPAPYKDFASVTPVYQNTVSIQIKEVMDLRKNTTQIGVARTGMQYQKTPIQAPEQLESYLAKYFFEAFADRKLKMQESDAEYNMTIKVNELWLEEKAKVAPEVVNCSANFTFELERTNNSKRKKKSWKGNIWTEMVSPGDMADGTTKIGPTFASCLNSVVEKLMRTKKFLGFVIQK
jgi:hypothetical protein